MFVPPNNCLRSQRKTSGLSQSEVAFLLGAEDGGHVSRYEKGHRLPTLRTATAFATIFGVSLSTLFSGIQIEVDSEVLSRLKQLHAKLEKKHEDHREAIADARKLVWLNERSSSLRKGSAPSIR